MRSLVLTLVLLLAAPAALAGEPSERTLSLAEAVDAAAEQNLTIAALEQSLEQAQGQLTQARGLLLPMVSAGGTWSHADHEDAVDMTSGIMAMFEELGFPIPDDVESEPTVVRVQDDVTGNLSASLSILNPQLWAAAHLAREGADLAEISVEQARQGLLMGVAQAWYAVHMTGALVEVQDERVQTSLGHLDVAERRQAAGAGLRIDVVRARTEVAQARQDLLTARLAWESARDALGVLTGLGGLPVAGEAPALQVPAAAGDALVAQALSAREDVAVARQNLALAHASLAASWAAFAPSVSLVWQGSYRFTEASGFGSDDPSRWTGVASLSVPLYSHSRFGDVHAKRAAVTQAEIKLQDVERSAGQAVRQALRDQQTSVAAEDLAQERAALAAEALGLAETAYAQGAGSSLEVSDAQTGQVAAEVNRLTSELRAQIATLSLLRALGADVLTVVR
ncbi:MAG: TolC family protein [Pseudomonadota bacterium]